MGHLTIKTFTERVWQRTQAANDAYHGINTGLLHLSSLLPSSVSLLSSFGKEGLLTGNLHDGSAEHSQRKITAPAHSRPDAKHSPAHALPSALPKSRRSAMRGAHLLMQGGDHDAQLCICLCAAYGDLQLLCLLLGSMACCLGLAQAALQLQACRLLPVCLLPVEPALLCLHAIFNVSASTMMRLATGPKGAALCQHRDHSTRQAQSSPAA